jgi:hypothetical protein
MSHPSLLIRPTWMIEPTIHPITLVQSGASGSPKLSRRRMMMSTSMGMTGRPSMPWVCERGAVVRGVHFVQPGYNSLHAARLPFLPGACGVVWFGLELFRAARFTGRINGIWPVEEPWSYSMYEYSTWSRPSEFS